MLRETEWPPTWWWPVPLHRQREKEWGFNQVELFARPLARHLRLPLSPGSSGALTPATGEAPAKKRKTMGVCTWRFCHT